MTSVTCYGQVIEVNHRYPMDLSLFYIISDIKLTSKKNTKLDISRCRIQCYINKVRMKITSGRIRIQMFQADDRLIKKARGTDKLKKIAVIHDLSGMGKCSLTAAIPVISAMGVQACPLPTAVLSNQTGYGSYFWDDYTDRMQLIMDEWKKMGFKPDGVYTGFLADARQVDVILKFTDMFCTDETHRSCNGRWRKYLQDIFRRTLREDEDSGSACDRNYPESYRSTVAFGRRTGHERENGAFFSDG